MSLVMLTRVSLEALLPYTLDHITTFIISLLPPLLAFSV